ncbi:MAG: NifB/NifX family molybdenum-iron cluster-binding protein [Marinilabiliaceae bacterium]|nr:NifB/NifX family molybdenum-iron cluster-binding protein [Marinilabiliaceae bacterium]
MKIAIPSRGGCVDDHFGHCEYYTIYEIDNNKNIINTYTLNSPEGCGCKSNIASTLHDDGVSVMLAGNIGQGAFDKLQASGIGVVRGCSGAVGDVVASYLKGNLTDNAQVCDHHDCHHETINVDSLRLV